MSLKQAEDSWQLHSPYLQISQIQLDDKISLLDDGRFILHGRLDRIVKIEEKRLSLTELEQRLMALPWVAETFTLLLTKHRDVVGAVIVLTKDGVQLLKTKGRKPLIKELRNALYQYFDAVVLPQEMVVFRTDVVDFRGQNRTTCFKTLAGHGWPKIPLRAWG